jgi:hypothetical protein
MEETVMREEVDGGLSIEDLGRKHTLMAVEFEPFGSGPGDWIDKLIKIRRR